MFQEVLQAHQPPKTLGQHCRASAHCWQLLSPCPGAQQAQGGSGSCPGTQHCSWGTAPAHSQQPLRAPHTSSPGFSRVSRNSPSSSSRWSRDGAQSCAGSSPWWLSSSASEAGGLW